MDDGCGEVDHGAGAFVCFVGPHCDAFEFLELAVIYTFPDPAAAVLSIADAEKCRLLRPFRRVQR